MGFGAQLYNLIKKKLKKKTKIKINREKKEKKKIDLNLLSVVFQFSLENCQK